MADEERRQQENIAQVGSWGANLFNSYQVLSHMASLYTKIAEYESVKTRSVWPSLSESVLADLGRLYQIWDDVVLSDRFSCPKLEDPVLARRITTFCSRLRRLEGLLDSWLPASRWAQVLLLCEKRWESILELFAAKNAALEPKLSEVRDECMGRRAKLVNSMPNRDGEEAA